MLWVVEDARIAPVREEDLAELLPLMRAYCDFYEVDPPDEALLEMSRALIADPEREGLQLMARNANGTAVGFATIFWSWSTTRAARIGVMNDLYVTADARGMGLAEGLIEACRDRARRHGAVSLDWQTAKDNLRAQTVYERIGAKREEWVDYSLPAAEAGEGSPGATTPDS
jgi:GNAT superfamily N-acetyltransferase